MSANHRKQQARQRATRERIAGQAVVNAQPSCFAQAHQAGVAPLDVSRQSVSRWHAPGRPRASRPWDPRADRSASEDRRAPWGICVVGSAGQRVRVRFFDHLTTRDADAS
jgi:hypothetical protein